ncbi:hypothetical protein KL930_003724 [Ogataea haglerorum]|uniref:Pre-mRNA-splicing factor CWC25 n=1 Tax=Ogataea haglerorum TaxID=1937702 RepID=A0AAN6I0F0_9ASCO|nr:uncharacterized protein KL911_003863 [Ogataea haglerorum]KAG7694405.1 hypothetical protein KL915_003372 [Ogataea haglerorum]KAG7695394.1 hypothetical protein KL951_003836 [Ogataea haglerorum]KAG7705258.1 hypothetical protein KL914_003944 [Ogataea haglerorum]KAG7716614.1 hypothetical protein KL913_003130 [Ogataea haglerorum]KAG7717632.1 hypothetical protein KL949_003466 [Ogataea haglerorum]
MVSDLNLKKSWNPRLLKNRTKVWEKERELLLKRREDTVHKDANNEMPVKFNQPKSLRIDWMYKNPVEHQSSGENSCKKNDHLSKLPIQRSKQTNIEEQTYVRHNSSDFSIKEPANGIDNTLLENDPINLISKTRSLRYQHQKSERKSDDSSKITKARLSRKKR